MKITPARRLTDGGWPDAERPGVPMNPDQDGYHWLTCPGTIPAFLYPIDWVAKAQRWAIEGRRVTPEDMVAGRPSWMPVYAYVGPCLTPTEHARTVAQARVEALREAAACCDVARQAAEKHYGISKGVGASIAKSRILALLTPTPSQEAREGLRNVQER